MSEQTPEAQFDVAAALVTTPLYAEIPAREPWKLAKTLRTFDGPIDLFCPSCGRESTYTSKPDMEAKTWANRASAALVSNSAAQNTYLQQQVAWLTPFSRVFVCAREQLHSLRVYFQCTNTGVVKVGQMPSLADIEKGDTAKYAAVLGRDRLKELNRGIGLYAHGFGIGAFIYLRRTFESLVEEAHQEAMAQPDWDESVYPTTTGDRIAMLRQYLPPFLVEHPHLYNILSEHIHTLTEDHCLQHFDAVLSGVRIILDQRLADEQRRKNEAEASKALSRIQNSTGRAK